MSESSERSTDELVEVLESVSARLEQTSTALAGLVASYLADKRWRRIVTALLGAVLAGSVMLGVLAVHTALRVSDEVAVSQDEQCLRDRNTTLSMHAAVDSVIDHVVGTMSQSKDWRTEWPEAAAAAEAAKTGIRKDMPARIC